MISLGRKWSPFSIGDHFYITSAPCNDDCREKLTIVMGPGRAFGSGEHETTQHCLELMTSIPLTSQQRVLDFGTGTGILAIAAAKMQAGFVLAIDIEFDAALSATNNSRLNQIEDRVKVVCGDVTCLCHLQPFDIILANLQADIILDRLELLSLLLNQHGYILISGIHWDYLFDIKREFTRLNYQIVSQKSGNEYNTLLFHKECN